MIILFSRRQIRSSAIIPTLPPFMEPVHWMAPGWRKWLNEETSLGNLTEDWLTQSMKNKLRGNVWGRLRLTYGEEADLRITSKKKKKGWGQS